MPVGKIGLKQMESNDVESSLAFFAAIPRNDSRSAVDTDHGAGGQLERFFCMILTRMIKNLMLTQMIT
jgi:hypothetical protein